MVMLTPALMVNDNDPVPVFDAESVTVTLVVVLPAAVGLPVIAPVVESESPAGREEPLETAHVYPVPEPPVAASVVDG